MIEIPADHNLVRLAATKDYLDLGADNAHILVFDGDRPAMGAPETTLLLDIELAKPASVWDAGRLKLVALEAVSIAVAAGAHSHAKIVNGAGNLVAMMDTSVVGGLGEVQLPAATLNAGDEVPLKPSYLT